MPSKFSSLLERPTTIEVRSKWASIINRLTPTHGVGASLLKGVSTGLELAHRHTVLVLTTLFGMCLLIIFFHMSQLKTQIVMAMSLQGAGIYSRALEEFRQWYTTEVVHRLHGHGIVASAEYQGHDGEIPLPATLSKALGKKLVSGQPGEEIRLISPFPFPGRGEHRGLTDAFQREAWEAFQRPFEKAYYRFEQENGRKVLRYAAADRMEAECVACHNTHPDSPKRDWQVGQVGGFLEVVYPVDTIHEIATSSLTGAYGSMGMLVVLWLGGFGLVILKLRRVAGELEGQVQTRTSDLQQANQQLELEIGERQQVENLLRQARDTLEKRVQERTGKLAAANAELIREVSERKRAEEDIRKLNTQLVQQTAQLTASNKELEAFSYSVSHDLRAPLRGIDGFSQAVLEDYADKLDEAGKSYLHRVRAASQRMSQLIDAMLNLARLTRAEIRSQTLDMTGMVNAILDEFQKMDPERKVKCVVAKNLFATADPQLIRAVLENLLGNAWKFTRQSEKARIEFGYEPYKGQPTYFVKDNGAGFDMTYAHKLFGAFQRLHAYTEYPGVGVGLATVHRIIHRHGGQIWADGAVGEGAVFHFTL